tara:strand:+ start:701 stop:1132 length:432 start_codon:yes stop_codon:yes gene_type:complete
MEKIKGFDNYEIDREGNVRNKTNRFLKQHKERSGYLYVGLRKDGKGYKIKIHRLLALQFIDNPDNLPWVDHIDRDKLNNNLDNLRWVTISQNSRNKECKGYYWNKEANKWKAQYKLNCKMHHIGYYDTEEQARNAYLEAIKDL